MKYYYDTEFWENGPGEPIRLISIGIVADDGREYYAKNSAFDWVDCNNAWLHENVKPHLAGEEKWRSDIAREIRGFIGSDVPEFIGYYSAYDHVALCQIFGRMIDLPKGWPMWTFDIKQWCTALGNPKLPKQTSAEHNALADARWNRDAYRFLSAYKAAEV